jgi:nucleotide-binding universal stress UspA family protein
MIRQILVPLDGSAQAERAIPVAARIARSTGSALLFVRVITPDYTAYYWPYAGPNQAVLPTDAASTATVAKAEHRAAQEYLTQVAGGSALAGLNVETLISSGIAGPSIIQAMEDRHPDLVVTSSHGRTGLSRWVLGSVAHHLVHHSPAPVLMLRTSPSSPGAGLADSSHPVRMLVTLDGSRAAETVLAPTADLCGALAGASPTELHLLLVVFQYAAPPDAAEQALLIGGAQGYLERVTAHLAPERAQTLRITSSVVTGSDIAITIAQAAEHGEISAGGTGARGYDLIAMATHGATGFARWALGSVTERVLESTHLPMLIVRPREVSLGPSPLATEQS